MDINKNAYKINAAIQLVPLGVTNSYEIVNLAIAEIEKSGFAFEVGPFSTSVEASMDEIFNLITSIKNRVFLEHTQEILINIQIHARKDGNVSSDEKVAKFRKSL